MNIAVKYVLMSILCFSAFSTLAETHYAVNSDKSSLSLSTIKKQYIVESAQIKGISGAFVGSKLSVKVPLKNITTGIPIRDSRLNALFFRSDLFPDIIVASDISAGELLATKQPMVTDVEINVTFFGQHKSYKVAVLLTPFIGGFSVSSVVPIIISADDFGVPITNLTALAKTVGGIAISNRVPVNFNLVFEKQY